MNETRSQLVMYVDNGGSFSLLTFLKSYKYLSLDQSQFGYITLESIRQSLIQNTFNETLSYRSAHLQVIFEVAISARMTVEGGIVLQLICSENEDAAFVGGILSFFDRYTNINKSQIIDFILACTNFVAIMKKPKIYPCETSICDDDSLKSKLLSREPTNSAVVSADNGGRSRGNSDASRADSLQSRVDNGHSKFLYLDNTRYMAQMRKQGSDIIFPQTTHDRVIAMIFVVLRRREWKPPHKDLIDFVMDCKERCAVNRGVDMFAVSKTKVRGIISLLKAANVLSLERPDRPAAAATKAAAAAVITPGTVQYRDRFLAIRSQGAAREGRAGVSSGASAVDPPLLPARLLLVDDVESFATLRARLDQHLVHMAEEMREDRIVRQGLWTAQFVWDKLKYGPEHSAAMAEYIHALEAFAARYLGALCGSAAAAAAPTPLQLLLLPEQRCEPAPRLHSPCPTIDPRHLGHISLSFLLSPDDRYTHHAPPALDTTHCSSSPYSCCEGESPYASPQSISTLGAVGSDSTHSPSSAEDGFATYSRLLGGVASCDARAAVDRPWTTDNASFVATTDSEASFIDDIMSKIGFSDGE